MDQTGGDRRCLPAWRRRRSAVDRPLSQEVPEHQLASAKSFCGPITWFGTPPYEPDVVYDEYGFMRSSSRPTEAPYINSAEQYAAHFQPKAARRAARWKQFRQEDPQFSNKARLKQLIRKGIPNECRAEVWSRCLGSHELVRKYPDTYVSYLSRAETSLSPQTLQQIDLDVGRTFPTNKLFRSGPGLDKLRRVLRAFAAYNPDVNYCQSMNFLAAILLVFIPEDLAFWSLVGANIWGRRAPRGVCTKDRFS